MTPPRRLGIVSAMSFWSWGGSEELWAATARAAVDAGWAVAASVGDGSSSKHDELRSGGVAIANHRMFFGSRRRLRSVAHRLVSPLHHLASFGPEVVLVSQGATYDVAGN